ncbi:MAG: 3-dehydroquinate synthase [Alphaproteobacteria bacterium]|nr:3-dehydroquinate synthase [Alphaproteobacteria bacterium]
MTMETKIVSISLDSRSYDIYIGSALLFRIQDFIPQKLEGGSVFIVTDRNVEPYAARVRDMITESKVRICEMMVLPPGEKTKSFSQVEKLCGWMLEKGLQRDSLVLAIGGGVIGDLAGFCASIAMRGVSYIQVPTTLLSQVDSSVGGKTGISTAQGKNLVGSFYQPKAVIADLDVLKTLPRRELLAGYAEIVKYGLIQDAGFFRWLEQNGSRVCALDEDALAYAIDVSCRAKAVVVQSDEREGGRRALLNFGHTFGHALEAAAGYGSTLLHGEAVALGMVMAFDLSHRMGLCPHDVVERVEAHLTSIGLPIRATMIDGLGVSVQRLIDIMQHDKKALAGKMVFVLANAIGEAFISGDVPEDLVRDVLRDSLGGEIKEAKGKWTSVFSSRS